MQYHYLLAGLEELSWQSGKVIAKEDLLAQMREQLSARDWDLVSVLLESPEDMELPEDHELSPLSETDRRQQLYFCQGLQSKNALLRAWFEFNMNLNNILTATICRKHGFSVKNKIVGCGEVADMLRRDVAAKDFGLTGICEEIQEILAVAAIENLLDRENGIDALRWNWLSEHTWKYDFQIENVICYYLQTEILRRWNHLSIEEGERVFKQIVADMKKGIKID